LALRFSPLLGRRLNVAVQQQKLPTNVVRGVTVRLKKKKQREKGLHEGGSAADTESYLAAAAAGEAENAAARPGAGDLRLHGCQG
jgi:hypothetical protein